MTHRRPRISAFLFGLAIGIAFTIQASYASLSYLEPAGGWRYTYDGTLNPGVVDEDFEGGVGPDGYGFRNTSLGGALDGTFRHDQGSRWDGSAPGDPLSDPSINPEGTSPGGAGTFVEGGTTFLRIQDAGNPESFGWCQRGQGACGDFGHPVNTNRRVYFGHDMQQDGFISEKLIMTVTGVTVSFRTRIPTTGPLDNVYTDSGQIIPWLEDAPNGRGFAMNNNRGMINIVQSAPDNVDTLVGLSLVTSTDVASFCDGGTGALCTGSGSGGLMMNNLNGSIPSQSIDAGGGGTLNMLEMADDDLNEWNEFWITLENNGAQPGNIRVSVYMNGSTVPDIFNVTLAGNNNSVYAREDQPYLEFGISDNSGFGAFDLDFISYQLGVHVPVAAPTANADFNNDGIVDGSDFLTWQRGFGSPGTPATGDANGDGNVDGLDLAIWESQFGTAPPLSAMNVVPEPTSLVMLLMASLGWTATRRR